MAVLASSKCLRSFVNQLVRPYHTQWRGVHISRSSGHGPSHTRLSPEDKRKIHAFRDQLKDRDLPWQYRQKLLSISPRTPEDSIGGTFNQADELEQHLQKNNSPLWGFVTVRCTYASDQDWGLCLLRMRDEIRRRLEHSNGQDLIDDGSFRLTLIEDPNELDEADSTTVRKHFNQWCNGNLQKEQGPGPKPAPAYPQEEASPGFRFVHLPPRYQYCIAINKASLESILADQGYHSSWVRFIKRDWDPGHAERARQRSRQKDLEGGYEIDELDYEKEVSDSVEGCDEEDVGWMDVYLSNVMLSLYLEMREPHWWDIVYVRPPGMAPLVG